ncbi:MAG: hypothetical protein ABGX25_00890 [Nautiliaceae bacterium]
MRGVKDGKVFENKYINENGQSERIEINKIDSNEHNTFCKNSYLDNKYYMKKEYKNGTIVDTRYDEHKKGRTKLMYVTIIGNKND